MKFTYNAYRCLLDNLKYRDYQIVGYHNYVNCKKCVILRHDVDTSLEKALTLAAVEHDEKVQSTYFLLLNTDFYNIASQDSTAKIHQIYKLGHEIGLHFDETKYNGKNCMGGWRI